MLAQHFFHLTREDHPERYVQTYRQFMHSLISIFFRAKSGLTRYFSLSLCLQGGSKGSSSSGKGGSKGSSGDGSSSGKGKAGSSGGGSSSGKGKAGSSGGGSSSGKGKAGSKGRL